MSLMTRSACSRHSLARPGLPGRFRRRRGVLGGVPGCVLVLSLVTAGCSSASSPAGVPVKTPGQAASPTWLCQPGKAPDPCAGNPAVSAVTASGTVRPAARPSSAAASKFACFYVNPTTSQTQTATGNTSLAVTGLDTYTSLAGTSRTRPVLTSSIVPGEIDMPGAHKKIAGPRRFPCAALVGIGRDAERAP